MAPKLGILAGSGELPGQLVRTCQGEGRPVFVLAFEGHTDPDSLARCEHAWVRLGAAGKAIEALKQAGALRGQLESLEKLSVKIALEQATQPFQIAHDGGTVEPELVVRDSTAPPSLPR